MGIGWGRTWQGIIRLWFPHAFAGWLVDTYNFLWESRGCILGIQTKLQAFVARKRRNFEKYEKKHNVGNFLQNHHIPAESAPGGAISLDDRNRRVTSNLKRRVFGAKRRNARKYVCFVSRPF